MFIKKNIICFVLFVFAQLGFSQKFEGVSYSNNLRVRNQPSLEGKVVKVLPCHTKVTVYDSEGSNMWKNGIWDFWYKISDSKDEWVNAYYIGLFPFVVSKPDFYVLVTGMDSDNNYEYFEYRNEDKGKFKDKEIYSFVEDSILIRSSNLAKYRINQNGKLSEERNPGYKYLYGVDVGMEWETLREIFEPNDGGAGVSAFDFGYQGKHYGVIIYLTDIDGPERIIRLE